MITKKNFRLTEGANKHGDVWSILQERGIIEHMCAFPLQLAERVISSTTAQTVLDPFMGSGTTAVAADNLGRQWIGIEKSKNYIKLANKRIKENRGNGLFQRKTA